MVRMAGTPAITYGCDIMGFSDAHLSLARGAIATAAAPESGGKNPSLVLYALDADGSTLDPAYDCHVAPIKSYALAHWQGWRPTGELCTMFDAAVHRLRAAVRSPWDVVSGPISALVATVWRLGWRIRSPCQFITDTGADIDVTIDSPAAVAAAAKASVRRWQLYQVVRCYPDMLPDEDDVVGSALPEDRLQLNEFYGRPDYAKLNDLSARLPQSVIDLGPVLGRLIHGKRIGARAVAGWTPACRPWLLSLVSGGQWPQARVAQAAGGDTSSLCQLCHEHTGTLEHRHCCQATLPDGGWPCMDAQARAFTDRLKPARRRLMESQGLLLVKARVERQRPAGWFRWLKEPDGDVPSSATWYVDGSLLDGPSRVLSVTGYSIVVVGDDGQLIGCAHGAPPSWITTAGAAEAFALYKVLTLNPFVPKIVTDCLGVLQSLMRGRHDATAANRINAKLWKMVDTCLDGTTWQEAASSVTWMPAHGARASIGTALKSSGMPVTAIDWRANRLADALAKAAAARFRVPHRVQHTVRTAFKAYEHAAMVAGVVTHAASNHFTSVTTPDGAYAHRKLRDAQPPAKSSRPAQKKHCEDTATTPSRATGSTPEPGPAPTVTDDPAPKRANAAGNALRAAAELRDARFIRTWHRDMAERPRTAATGPTAQERLLALQLRVRAKSLATA